MRARGKPGRPIGSRTFRETPAVKRARQFFELQYEGMKPTAAVADPPPPGEDEDAEG